MKGLITNKHNKITYYVHEIRRAPSAIVAMLYQEGNPGSDAMAYLYSKDPEFIQITDIYWGTEEILKASMEFYGEQEFYRDFPEIMS